MLLDFMSDLPNPVETTRRPLTIQVRVMTWSDLTGNSERLSEMATRREQKLGQYFARSGAGESNRRVDTLVVLAVNDGC